MVLSRGLLDGLIFASTAVLAAVFALAAYAKLRDVERARAGLAGFGVPERWTRRLVFVLAALELLIAAQLAFPATRAAGAWCALGALAAFSVAIGWQLVHGRRPACACFGAFGGSSIGWHSIARNLVLTALAGTMLLPIAPAGIRLPVNLPVLLCLLWAAISGIWLLLLTRQNGRLLLRIEQLEHDGTPAASHSSPIAPGTTPLQAGAVVPSLALSDTRGRLLDLGSLRGTAVLLFLDTACTHCRPLLEQLQQRRPAGVTLAVVSETGALRHQLPGEIAVLVDPGRASAALFGVRGTPAAVLIDEGRLAQPAVHGTAPVRELLEQYTVEEVQHAWAPV